MLNKNHRKLLLERNLLYLLEKDSNPHQLWQRMKSNCILAINDLTLIASKCPDEKLQQIFNESSLNNLLQNIFQFYETEQGLKRRLPDLRLASLFASIAIQSCIYEFQKWN